MPRIVAVGETIVDFIATEGVPYENAKTFEKCFGGAPMNTAVGAARLGIETGVITAVGDDPFGSFAKKTLRANGVDTSYVKSKKGLRTTISFVLNDLRTGENKFVFYRKPNCETADSNLAPEDIPKRYIQSADILHVSGFALSQEPSRSAILHALDVAKKARVKISFDPTLRKDVWSAKSILLKIYRKVLEKVDLATFSMQEAKVLLGSAMPKDAARVAFDRGVPLVGFKRGPKGSVIVSKEGEYHDIRAFRVKPVDVTGAGDAWNAAFLTGITEGRDLRTCATMANAAGALAVTVRGAINAMPTRNELELFMKSRGFRMV